MTSVGGVQAVALLLTTTLGVASSGDGHDDSVTGGNVQGEVVGVVLLFH